MDGLLPDPFTGLVQGLLQGVAIRHQMQQEADTHAAMQRQQIQQDRSNRIQDIQQRMLLEGNSRPVNNGTVTEQGNPIDADLGNGVTSSTPMSIQRPADKSRTVKYKDIDGNEYQRELLTPAEQIQRDVEKKTAITHAGQTDVSGLMGRMLTQPQEAPTVDPATGSVTSGSMGPAAGTIGAPQQNRFPGGVFVPPGSVPAIMNDMAADQLVPTTPQQQALGAPAMVRMRDMPSYTRSATTRADNQANVDAKTAPAGPRPVKTVQDDKGVWNVVYSDGSKKSVMQGSVKPVKAAAAGDGAGGGAVDKLGGYTQASLDSLAQSVADGVPLSQVVSGMGAKVAEDRKRVFNRAVEMNPGLDLALARSGYSANEGSLKKFTAQRDQITSFENTAGKNLDAFLGTAKKMIDLGSPFVNRPVRSIALAANGDKELTDMNTARTVAITEAAKVLNNPGGNAALSDSARKEVNELMRPDLTLQQAYTVASRLRSDMKNRSQAMDNQIARIQHRISSRAPEPPDDSGTPAPGQSSGGHVIELNGKHYQYKGAGATDDISNYSEVKQ